jgi:hypothetical protein
VAATTGGLTRNAINIREDYDLWDWSRKFDVTVEELKQAMYSVCHTVDEVRHPINQ